MIAVVRQAFGKVFLTKILVNVWSMDGLIYGKKYAMMRVWEEFGIILCVVNHCF